MRHRGHRRDLPHRRGRVRLTRPSQAGRLTADAIDAACRALPGVSHVVQWGGADVYKVGPRIFAVFGLGEGALSLKVSEIAREVLLEQGRARPAPYLARAGWVRFDDLDRLDADEGRELIAAAHALIAAKLTRAERRAIGLEDPPAREPIRR